MATTTSSRTKFNNHKKLVGLLCMLILVGIGLIFYAMYSSSRNDGDGAAERNTPKVTGTGQQSGATDISAQQQSTVSPQKQESKVQPAAPASGGSQIGKETSLKLYADSGNELVNTVQTVVTYPADALQFVSISNGTAFPQEFGTDTATPGTIRVVRAVNSQAQSVKGEQLVATVTFKVLKDINPAAVVLVDKSESFLVTSKDNRNLLNTSAGSLTLRK